MPIEFTFTDNEHPYDIHTCIAGPVRDSDLTDYMRSVLAHERYRPGLSALVECRDVHLVAINAMSVARLARFTREQNAMLTGSVVAVVATQPLVYGFARMYKMLRNPPYAFAVFRQLSEAETWLAKRTA